MGTKNRPSRFDCYHEALPDEPMFVLLARDADAPDRVREWARRRLRSLGQIVRGSKSWDSDKVRRRVRKIAEAMDCADNMVAWRQEHLDLTE